MSKRRHVTRIYVIMFKDGNDWIMSGSIQPNAYYRKSAAQAAIKAHNERYFYNGRMTYKVFRFKLD